MKYKLKEKALDDPNAAVSYIMDTIIHTTEAKWKVLFMQKKTRCNFSWLHYYFYWTHKFIISSSFTWKIYEKCCKHSAFLVKNQKNYMSDFLPV